MFSSVSAKNIDSNKNYITVSFKELNIIINLFKHKFENNLLDKKELDLFIRFNYL